jgi:hypothetical protein
MTTINAIQTEYQGHLFRSRLEARWAVFFDYLGIKWSYEPEGFEVGFGNDCLRRYLPDFFLPDLGVWVEVKGDNSTMDWTLIGDACDWEGCHLPQWSKRHQREGKGSGVLVLGPIPSEQHTSQQEIVHPFVYSSDTFCGGVTFSYAKFYLKETFTEVLERYWALSVFYFGEDGYGTYSCRSKALYLDDTYSIHYRTAPNSEPWWQIQRAYRAARSARFEHGYSGATL